MTAVDVPRWRQDEERRPRRWRHYAGHIQELPAGDHRMWEEPERFGDVPLVRIRVGWSDPVGDLVARKVDAERRNGPPVDPTDGDVWDVADRAVTLVSDATGVRLAGDTRAVLVEAMVDMATLLATPGRPLTVAYIRHHPEKVGDRLATLYGLPVPVRQMLYGFRAVPTLLAFALPQAPPVTPQVLACWRRAVGCLADNIETVAS